MLDVSAYSLCHNLASSIEINTQSKHFIHVFNHYFQTSSSLKPLGQSKPKGDVR